uniref:Uncharacterized protein n=1 Tax=Arundo donax TaxID=35708 RepID=A0A0A8YQN6_ARUDO
MSRKNCMFTMKVSNIILLLVITSLIK